MKILTHKGEKITLNKISSFFEGNLKYLYDKLIGLEDLRREQVFYRMYSCKDTCLKRGECIKCFCDVPERFYVDKPYESRKCNFPDFMEQEEWTKYKLSNQIDIDEIIKEFS